jgi:predicted amidohydrolase
MSDLTFSLIQTKLHWEDKAANLDMLEAKIRSIPSGTHIIVLPEMFSTGFSMQPEQLAEDMNGPTVAWMQRMAAEKKAILTGSVIIQETTETANGDERHYFNRLIWMLPNGQYATYDKRHLFGFAGEDRHYKAGTKRLIASVNGWKICLQICYDLRFPVWSRQAPELEETTPAEYDVLLYVANWPERRIHAWKTLLMARAIENQCYTIGLNRVGEDGNGIYHNGNSLVCDALGTILYEKEHEEAIHTIALSKENITDLRSKMPFLKDADAFRILS